MGSLGTVRGTYSACVSIVSDGTPSPDVEILDDKHDAVETCPIPVRIKARRAPKGFFGYRCTPEEK